MCHVHPPAPPHPCGGGWLSMGHSAARAILRAQTGLYLGHLGSGGELPLSAPVTLKQSGHSLAEILFTWINLQPSVSATDSAHTSSVFQSSCCLTDPRHLSFILALFLFSSAVQRSAFKTRYKENKANCHELGLPTAHLSPSSCLLHGIHGLLGCASWHMGLFPIEESTGPGKLWIILPTCELQPHLDWAVEICPSTEKLEMWWVQSFTQLKLWRVVRQERGYNRKLNWNLTVTLMLTKYVSLNDSQVWSLKPANGEIPVAWDHNPAFSPEKHSCAP